MLPLHQSRDFYGERNKLPLHFPLVPLCFHSATTVWLFPHLQSTPLLAVTLPPLTCFSLTPQQCLDNGSLKGYTKNRLFFLLNCAVDGNRTHNLPQAMRVLSCLSAYKTFDLHMHLQVSLKFSLSKIGNYLSTLTLTALVLKLKINKTLAGLPSLPPTYAQGYT